MKMRNLREIARRGQPEAVEFPTVDLAREVAKKRRKKKDKRAPLDAVRKRNASY